MAVIKHGSSGTGGTESLKFAMDGLTGESGSAVCVTGYSITTKQEVKEDKRIQVCARATVLNHHQM